MKRANRVQVVRGKTVMTTDSEFREQRRSFRCPVSDDRQPADLRWGKRRIGVQVVDESAGGFAVLIPALPAALEMLPHPGATPPAETGTPPITDQPDDLAAEPSATASRASEPKERLELHTPSGVFEVAICHCKEAEPPKDWPPRGLACESDGRARQRGDSLGLFGWTQADTHPHKASDGGAAAVAEPPTCYRLGLQRVREIEPYELAQERAARRSPWLPMAKMFPKNHGSMITLGTLVVVLGVAGMLALVTGSREAIMRWADDDFSASPVGQLAADGTAKRGQPAADAATDQLGRATDEAADANGEAADAVADRAGGVAAGSARRRLPGAHATEPDDRGGGDGADGGRGGAGAGADRGGE